jgi:bifunctional non-homologous end joining protein LigD
MGLKEYTLKRHFDETPEPTSRKKARHGGELVFVVQRHQASRLHYDFRLEMDGVLKSWAVPKGPSMDPADKRLAMMVEDHPYAYRTFEGEIPEGNYGAGIVEIWDEGTYTVPGVSGKVKSEREILKALENGNLKFELHGKKLHGQFALVKMHGKQENAWLLIKHRDEYAEEGYDSERHVEATSRAKRKTSRRHTKSTSPKAEESSEHGQERMPDVDHIVKPMLARLHSEPFNDPGWIFEVKFDGYRAIADVDHGVVELYSRNGKTFRDLYHPVVTALEQLDVQAVLDGEVVVPDSEGRSRFQLLQQYQEKGGELLYYAFDLLELNGHDIRHLPLEERKKLLQTLLPGHPILRYSDHVQETGKEFFREASKRGLEGIIAKRSESTYMEGVRGSDWLKIKVHQRQEAVICGFTEPRGQRKYMGALVLGVYDGSTLMHAGNCGSGFTTEQLHDLRQKFEPYIQKTSPFGKRIATPSPVTYLKPELVCEVEFGGWTDDGRMRHPIFQGLREDKPARDVVREQPDDESQTAVPAQLPKTRKKDSRTTEIDGHPLLLTHPDKVYWPDEGYTKGDVIAYYAEMADILLPYLKNRPQSLHRHPNGINEEGFYQKNMPESLPAWIATVEMYAESAGRTVRYLLCQDRATLAYMNNLGCIEIHPWNSCVSSLDCPDYIVIDLDPGDNEFGDVIETAHAVKEVLDRAGAEAYCKTSGATGMHIYIPLGARYSYDEAQEFAHIIAQLTHELLPELTSLERSPKARRKQIYLDVLQNRAGQTLASVYSLRPRPGAPVSAPLEWKELKKGLHPSQFTIATMQKRLARKGDLFAPVLERGIDMLAALKRLGA